MMPWDTPELQKQMENISALVKQSEERENEIIKNSKTSIMSNWVNSILDRWIFSRRNLDYDKYWKIVAYYAVSDNDRMYRPSLSMTNASYVFKGYHCKIWEEPDLDSSQFFLCEGESLQYFDFNKYVILDDKEIISQLDLSLAKNLLQQNVHSLVKDYDFDDFF